MKTSVSSDESQSFRNTILRNLPPDVIERLALRPVLLPLRTELEKPGRLIDRFIFLESGVASMTTTFEDGGQVEVTLFGLESVIGASALMGTKASLNRVYMQIAGAGFVSSLVATRREFRACGRFHDLILRYVQTQLVQATQSAGCNVAHTVEQRLARWLLLCAERSQADTFAISQEFVGMMLGVRRASVTYAMGRLRDRGILDVRRNHIHILNSRQLEGVACECFVRSCAI